MTQNFFNYGEILSHQKWKSLLASSRLQISQVTWRAFNLERRELQTGIPRRRKTLPNIHVYEISEPLLYITCSSACPNYNKTTAKTANQLFRELQAHLRKLEIPEGQRSPLRTQVNIGQNFRTQKLDCLYRRVVEVL